MWTARVSSRKGLDGRYLCLGCLKWQPTHIYRLFFLGTQACATNTASPEALMTPMADVSKVIPPINAPARTSVRRNPRNPLQAPSEIFMAVDVFIEYRPT